MANKQENPTIYTRKRRGNQPIMKINTRSLLPFTAFCSSSSRVLTKLLVYLIIFILFISLTYVFHWLEFTHSSFICSQNSYTTITTTTTTTTTDNIHVQAKILSPPSPPLDHAKNLSSTLVQNPQSQDNKTQSITLDNEIQSITLVQNPQGQENGKHSKTLGQSTERQVNKTELHHIVFGIASSSKLYDQRSNYIRTWWRPEMRGYIWVEKPVKDHSNHNGSLAPVKISSDISRFKYTNKIGDRSGLRISRIVSETFRLGLEDVSWFVMGDDDTVFVPDNLVRVLQKYDHNQFHYIGSVSESHLQNLEFSYKMAYGGGGFAISYPLAQALEKMQDRCIQRYPYLYGSDDRIQACMAELGVSLTKEVGFHQFDFYGNVFGLLAAHPVTPLVSMHHLDVIDPIFPHMNQLQALEKLQVPTKLDSAAILQQSVCYDDSRKWTVSVSWGYAVQIIPDIIPAREMEIPTRTFLNWYPKADHTAFAFNTRPPKPKPCQRPSIYMFSNASYDSSTSQTTTEYKHYVSFDPRCKMREIKNPSSIDKVVVYKNTDPNLWDKQPRRRNCCRVLQSSEKDSLAIDVGACHDDEVIELPENK